MRVGHALAEFDQLPQRRTRPVATRVRTTLIRYRRHLVLAAFEPLALAVQNGAFGIKSAVLLAQFGIALGQALTCLLLRAMQRDACRVVAVEAGDPLRQCCQHGIGVSNLQLAQAGAMTLPAIEHCDAAVLDRAFGCRNL